jgi:hypothetical protein
MAASSNVEFTGNYHENRNMSSNINILNNFFFIIQLKSQQELCKGFTKSFEELSGFAVYQPLLDYRKLLVYQAWKA